MNATVVFDGYGSGASVKDHEHLRRAACAAPDVVFESHKAAYCNQGAFLANEKNKKSFVSFLIEEFELSQICVYQATADADTLIASKRTP